MEEDRVPRAGAETHFAAEAEVPGGQALDGGADRPVAVLLAGADAQVQLIDLLGKLTLQIDGEIEAVGSREVGDAEEQAGQPEQRRVGVGAGVVAVLPQGAALVGAVAGDACGPQISAEGIGGIGGLVGREIRELEFGGCCIHRRRGERRGGCGGGFGGRAAAWPA